MNEHPILFSGDMVRAILEGHKTVTRRVPSARYLSWKRGDRLWVRETWWHPESFPETLPSGDIMDRPRMVSRFAPVFYAADGNPPNTPNQYYVNGLREGCGVFSAPDPYVIWTKRPSIHMPRWASRITLRLTADVYEEPLQKITEEDAKAEGMELHGGWDVTGTNYAINYVNPYTHIWDSIYASRGFSWASNPTVAVIRFEGI